MVVLSDGNSEQGSSSKQMPYADQIANFTLHVRTISDICTIVLEQKSMQDNFIERHVNAHVG